MSPAEATDLARFAAGLGLDIEPAAVERIGRFVDLLEVWNRRLRLTGDRDRASLLRKHVTDSIAVTPHLPSKGPVVDLGSGAGFPGIVLACVRPALELRLVEPRRRPVSFLNEAIRTIPLPAARALEERAEALAGDESIAGKARLAVSRALRIDLFLRLASPLLAPDGRVVAMQTPGVSAAAVRLLARPLGLDLLQSTDYRLPGGESRRLLILARA